MISVHKRNKSTDSENQDLDKKSWDFITIGYGMAVSIHLVRSERHLVSERYGFFKQHAIDSYNVSLGKV